MAIIVRLDAMLAHCKTRSKDLAARIDVTEANLSLLKSGKVKGVRFDTLPKICDALDCQHGDLLEFEPDAEDRDLHGRVALWPFGWGRRHVESSAHALGLQHHRALGERCD